MGGSNSELQDLTNRFIDRKTAYGMKVCTEKSKLMANSINNISADVSMNGQKLEEVTSLKYMDETLCKDGTCLAEVCIRIASEMAAVAGLNRLWWCNTTSLESKLKLCKSLVTSILLYGCEAWTRLADSEKRIQASKLSARGNFSISPTWSTKPTTECRKRSTPLWVHRNLFWLATLKR